MTLRSFAALRMTDGFEVRAGGAASCQASRSGTACRAPTVEVLTVYIRRNRAADPQRLKPQRKELVTARLKSCFDVREFSGIAGACGWPSQAALKQILWRRQQSRETLRKGRRCKAVAAARL